jgi:anticodon-binding protein
VKPEQLFSSLRVALCGHLASPGIFDVLRSLGKPGTLENLDAALRALGDQAARG